LMKPIVTVCFANFIPSTGLMNLMSMHAGIQVNILKTLPL
jgi:hypothetical protein